MAHDLPYGSILFAPMEGVTEVHINLVAPPPAPIPVLTNGDARTLTDGNGLAIHLRGH